MPELPVPLGSTGIENNVLGATGANDGLLQPLVIDELSAQALLDPYPTTVINCYNEDSGVITPSNWTNNYGNTIRITNVFNSGTTGYPLPTGTFRALAADGAGGWWIISQTTISAWWGPHQFRTQWYAQTLGYPNNATGYLYAGVYAIYPWYSGDATFPGCLGPAWYVQTINKLWITVNTPTTSNTAPVFGQPFTITATINIAYVGATGTLNFYAYSPTAFGDANWHNCADVAITSGVTGSVTGFGGWACGNVGFYAYYPGDVNFNPAQSANLFTTNIVPCTPTVGIVSNNNSPIAATSFLLTATVYTPYGTAAWGNITFYNGNTNLGLVNIAGSPNTASLWVSFPTVGNVSLWAQYSGDSVNTNGANSAAITLYVSPMSTTVDTYNLTGSPILPHVDIMYQANVNANTTPGGSITFYSLSTSAPPGTDWTTIAIVPLISFNPTLSYAQIVTRFPTVGSYKIAANYYGDANHLTSYSDYHVVQVIACTVTVTCSSIHGANISYYGTPVTFVVNLTAGAAGTIQLYYSTDNGSTWTYFAIPPIVNNVATITYSGSPVLPIGSPLVIAANYVYTDGTYTGAQGRCNLTVYYPMPMFGQLAIETVILDTSSAYITQQAVEILHSLANVQYHTTDIQYQWVGYPNYTTNTSTRWTQIPYHYTDLWPVHRPDPLPTYRTDVWPVHRPDPLPFYTTDNVHASVRLPFHWADSGHRWIQTTDHTIDSTYAKFNTRHHDTNILLYPWSTHTTEHTIDYLVRQIIPKTFTTDSDLKGSSLKPHNTNTAIFAQGLPWYETDSDLRGNYTRSYTTDNTQYAVVSKSHNTNTVKYFAILTTHDTDSTYLFIGAPHFTTDTQKLAHTITHHTIDTVHYLISAPTHDTDITVENFWIRYYTTDNLLRSTLRKFHNADSFVATGVPPVITPYKFTYIDDYGTIYTNMWTITGTPPADTMDITTIIEQPYIWGQKPAIAPTNLSSIISPQAVTIASGPTQPTIYRRGIITIQRMIMNNTPDGYIIHAEGHEQYIGDILTSFSCERLTMNPFKYTLNNTITEEILFELTPVTDDGSCWTWPDDTINIVWPDWNGAVETHQTALHYDDIWEN